jgi:Domain of unknown function (DUF4340)
MAEASKAKANHPLQRKLAILTGATVVFVLLAVVAVFQQSGSLARKFEPRPFFPGLSNQLDKVGEVSIASKSGSFHLKLVDGKWVVTERDSFPADAAQMRALGVGLAELQMLEPKTARADWLTYIGLGAPPDGDGVDVRLTDTAGQPLAEILLGQTEGMPDELGRTTLYVRRPNENQSYLARGYLNARPNIADWLDKGVVIIAADRMKGATVSPPVGPSYSLVRDSKDQQDFRLLDIPRGRELSFPGSPDGVAGAVVGFTYDDVAKADQFNFARAPQWVGSTFDGLNLTVKIASKGAERWATVSAMATDPMVQAEADAINARVNGWAFKLPESKVTQFLATRETLLKPADDAG